MKKRKLVLLLSGFFTVYACNLTPGFTPTLGEGPILPSGATEGIPIATPEPAATETPSPTIPAGFFPIVVGNAYNPEMATLLGGTENGAWIDAATAAARLSGGETYTLYAPTGPVGTAVGSKPAQDIICPQYNLEWSPPPSATSLVGLGGGWNALPRTPVESSADAYETYRKVVVDWLAAQGYPDVEVLRPTSVLLIDLDGDGIVEALIRASRTIETNGHDVAAGDYSLVLLYGETVPRTIRLAGKFYPDAQSLAFPESYSVLSVLDLNGDGRMEVLVDMKRWEGGGTLVFTFDGATALPVFESACSA